MAAESHHEFTPKDHAELVDEDRADMVFQRDRCCSCLPRLGSLRSAPAEEGRRWVNALMKVREWTEVAAGPRWKTFIRRFNRTSRSGGHGKFQYDPLSYALNFDEGENNGDLDEEEHVIRGNFSMRYAAVPADLDKDAPPFA
ncbi:hypothetical protein C3L33_00726, partial [Rhododendron williamsianum]